MGIKILVVEDEAAINDVLCMSLNATGYEAVPFSDGEQEAEALAHAHDYGCAVVDIMLPGRDGFSLLEELKSYGVPVIFLTAGDGLSNKVKGLCAGAEDYMTKPFEMLELLIRIQKVLERKGAFASEIRIKDVVIDSQKHTVTKNGEEVYLKPMEFEGETRTVDAASEHCRRKGCVNLPSDLIG